ncbi:MAG: hypothetical protein ACRDTH_00700 [Pseudonocardiaceae bacterium]
MGMGSEQGWAGGPRCSIDELLRELVDRADEVLGAQARLRGLLDAVVTIATDLSLPAMLRRIVQAACDLADARYGALGVLAAVVTRARPASSSSDSPGEPLWSARRPGQSAAAARPRSPGACP